MPDLLCGHGDETAWTKDSTRRGDVWDRMLPQRLRPAPDGKEVVEKEETADKPNKKHKKKEDEGQAVSSP